MHVTFVNSMCIFNINLTFRAKNFLWISVDVISQSFLWINAVILSFNLRLHLLTVSMEIFGGSDTQDNIAQEIETHEQRNLPVSTEDDSNSGSN